jgi:dTDP-4-amino-4,6-dideoxygalactose transaminase
MSVNDRQRHLAGAIVFESYDEIGFNYRLTDIQAAIGREQLRRLPQLLLRRRELATYYQRCLSRVAELRVPHDRHDTRSNWQSFHIILPRGVEQVRIMTRLLSAGISTRRGVMCAHLESAYANTSCGRNLVNSEFARDHSVILPLFPAMSEADIDRVVEAVEDALRLES